MVQVRNIVIIAWTPIINNVSNLRTLHIGKCTQVGWPHICIDIFALIFYLDKYCYAHLYAKIQN